MLKRIIYDRESKKYLFASNRRPIGKDITFLNGPDTAVPVRKDLSDLEEAVGNAAPKGANIYFIECVSPFPVNLTNDPTQLYVRYSKI